MLATGLARESEVLARALAIVSLFKAAMVSVLCLIGYMELHVLLKASVHSIDSVQVNKYKKNVH